MSFHNKNSYKNKYRGGLIQFDKEHLQNNSTAKTTHKRLKAFSQRLGTSQRCLLSLLLANIALDILVSEIRQEREIKDIWIIKE